MMQKYFLCYFLVFVINPLIIGQQETYSIKVAPFSSNKFDEFSPVYYKTGIVFCSNRKTGSLSYFLTSEGGSPFKIYYVDTTVAITLRNPRLLSKSLKSPLNDGPVTFNSRGDTIYFSRNLRIDGNFRELSASRNKLGIFSAVLGNKTWENIRELRFNNDWYNITTPSLSPDGKRLYFASDKPDGYGGSDIYYCEWKGEYWDNPINLGPSINTGGNEAYPFITSAGELFFSSDQHAGFGGKDIFYSRLKKNEWLPPVHLDGPINSQFDDFGIVLDSMMDSGYFSSNRGSSLDIYEFKTNFKQIFYPGLQDDNSYCFLFTDSGGINRNTLNLEYIWDFGDGIQVSGKEVTHCFPGYGKYMVRLDVFDISTGNLFFNKLKYDLEIKEFEQPYINSINFSTIGDTLIFDGLKSFLPGYKILNYTWNMGDGNKIKGEIVKYSYNKQGEYKVSLGVTIRSQSTGAILSKGVSKIIRIFKNIEEKNRYLDSISEVKLKFPEIRTYSNAIITNHYSAEDEIDQDGFFRLEVLSSLEKLGPDNKIFKPLLKHYFIREYFNSEKNLYSYIIEEGKSPESLYPAFKNVLGLGFIEARLQTYIPVHSEEKELLIIKNIYGNSADNFFIRNDVGLSSGGYAILDQVAAILNKYPDKNLLIEVHSDEIGSVVNNLKLSEDRALSMVNYLVSKSINRNRIIIRSYGKSRPLVSSDTEMNRRINRRVEFVILGI